MEKKKMIFGIMQKVEKYGIYVTGSVALILIIQRIANTSFINNDVLSNFVSHGYLTIIVIRIILFFVKRKNKELLS